MKTRRFFLAFMLLVSASCTAVAPPTTVVIGVTTDSTDINQPTPGLKPTQALRENATATLMLPTVSITVAHSAATMTPTIVPVQDPVLIGAGDIAGCDSPGAAATAKLLDAITGTIFTTGDNAYPSGTSEQFLTCYDPTWGRYKTRTRPTPGNHDYETAGAAAYYAYFGASAGDPGRGYYSYDLASWHIVALNSNCWAVGGCNTGSPQYQWLIADLATHPAKCTLAYWHHPRFSSGPHGSSTEMQAFWQALYAANAEVVLNGHDHIYERFSPQDPGGAPDLQHGIREFVVGSGGHSHYGTGTPIANSEVRNSDTFGVLSLTLHADRYDWRFIPEAGKSFTDSGTTPCH